MLARRATCHAQRSTLARHKAPSRKVAVQLYTVRFITTQFATRSFGSAKGRTNVGAGRETGRDGARGLGLSGSVAQT